MKTKTTAYRVICTIHGLLGFEKKRTVIECSTPEKARRMVKKMKSWMAATGFQHSKDRVRMVPVAA